MPVGCAAGRRGGRGDIRARPRPEQLVDGDPEPGELEQRLEREPALAALGLRDRARRDPGQAGEVGLRQAALEPDGPQRRPEPRRGGRPLERRPAVRPDPAAVDAALNADRTSLGLGDPKPAVADDDDALRHVLDRPPHGLEPLALGERPVGDRAHLEQHRAAADEEAAGAVDAPTVGHRVERVEDQQIAPIGPARPPDGVQERRGAVERAAGRGVDRLEPGNGGVAEPDVCCIVVRRGLADDRVDERRGVVSV